jgi:hypothetical protein
MKYTVLWAREAERHLATLWTESEHRQAITEAANAIDKQLLHDPERIGESRPDGTRILFVPPLGVLFSIKELDFTVSVLTVWQFKKKTSS